jgi:hypothetical protein
MEIAPKPNKDRSSSSSSLKKKPSVKQSHESPTFSPIPSQLHRKLPLPVSHSKKSTRQLDILRALLLFAISLAGILSGGLSYYLIREYQVALYEANFGSMIHHHFKGMQKALNFHLYSNLQLATALGLICPSEEDWPNCPVPMKTFDSRTQIFELTEPRKLAVVPIVQPEDKRSFEDFVVDFYQNQGGYANGTGSKGIYPSQQSTSESLAAPLLFLSNSSSDSPLLFDLYSDSTMNQTINRMIDCVQRFNPEIDQAQQLCSELTNFLPELFFSNLAIVTPILPTQGPSTTMVGILGTLISWESLIANSLSPDFHFQCAIQSSTPSGKQSFLIQNGHVTAINGIESNEHSHDKLLHQLQRSFSLSLGSSLGNQTVTYSSSEKMPSPLLAITACVSCVAIAILIILIFCVFNSLVESAALESCLRLDSKRTYVRFVSHEIR